MSKVEEFLTSYEEAAIVEAIRLAELNTSGEIRVHLEATKGSLDAFDRATQVFSFLHMDNTKLSNGVLIYVAVEDHSLVIIGDSGINNLVPKDFWESTKDIIIDHFKNNKMAQGLVAGIEHTGIQLKKHFPYVSDDSNELPNEISAG